jgi:hypothetical protein
MTAIALAIFIVFILYVMLWSVRNDGAKSIGDQKGLIKMRDPLGRARKSARHLHRGRQQPPAPRHPEKTDRRF